jgi:DNA polymerase-3 subunit beta
MKIQVSQEELSYGIQVVQRAVAAKTTLPVLTGILCRADEQGLLLCATDQEIGIQCRLPATVAQSGQAVIPARIFGDLVRRLPSAMVEIEVDQNTNIAEISSQRARFSVHGFDPAEFPALPAPRADTGVYELKCKDLRSLIHQTLFAVSRDENRPFLTGLLFHAIKDEIRFVSTDGYRMAFSSRPAVKSAGDRQAIIPGRALSEMARILTGDDEMLVKVSVGENQVFFDLGRLFLVSRLIEGQFPNYENVIYHQLAPEQFKTRIRMKTADLVAAADRAAVVASEAGHAMRFEIRDDGVVVTSNTPEVGRVREDLQASKEGDDLEIAFQVRYVSDGVRPLEAEECVFEFTGPINPSRLKAAESGDYIYIVLPLRTL